MSYAAHMGYRITIEPARSTDLQLCSDGGCVPAERAWGVLMSCVGWVSCDLGGPARCYHCIEWSPDPRAL